MHRQHSLRRDAPIGGASSLFAGSQARSGERMRPSAWIAEQELRQRVVLSASGSSSRIVAASSPRPTRPSSPAEDEGRGAATSRLPLVMAFRFRADGPGLCAVARNPAWCSHRVRSTALLRFARKAASIKSLRRCNVSVHPCTKSSEGGPHE